MAQAGPVLRAVQNGDAHWVFVKKLDEWEALCGKMASIEAAGQFWQDLSMARSSATFRVLMKSMSERDIMDEIEMNGMKIRTDAADVLQLSATLKNLIEFQNPPLTYSLWYRITVGIELCLIIIPTLSLGCSL